MRNYLNKVKIVAVSASIAAMGFGGLAVLADATPTPTPTVTPSVKPERTPKPRREVDLACMQTAIEKRENAIIAAFDAYHTAGVAALNARKVALKAAWGISDRKERARAINAAWKDYRTAIRKARADLKNAKHEAWRQYKSDAKNCNGKNEEDGGEGADSIL